MYETVNDSFKINYNNKAQEEEARYRAEILERTLYTVAGFSAETFDMDFAFNVRLDHPGYALSLYKNGKDTYIGIYDTKTKTVNLECDLSILRSYDQNSIDALLEQLHANELHSNECHQYFPNMNMANVKNAWHKCLSYNKNIHPTKRESVNVNNKEMTVRHFYDISVARPRKEFICWMLDKNPSENDKKSMASMMIERICKELEEKQMLESVSAGLRKIQNKIDDYER